MVGSAPPFQRLDQWPSTMSCRLLLSALHQGFAFSSSADSSSVVLPANCITSSSLGSGTSMTPNGFFIGLLQPPTATSCADRRGFAVSRTLTLAKSEGPSPPDSREGISAPLGGGAAADRGGAARAILQRGPKSAREQAHASQRERQVTQ